MASYSIVKMKQVPTGNIYCLKKTVNSWGGSLTSYSDCLFVPDVSYPDLSKVNIQTTTTGWFYNYDEFVPKTEKLFLDILFLIGLFLFLWFLLKFVFRSLFK